MRASRTLLAWLVLGAGCSALIDADADKLRNPPAHDGATDPSQGDDGGAAQTPLDGGQDAPDASQSACGDCSDGVACTVDACESGACTHTPDDAACTAGERCNPGRGCVPERCVDHADCDDQNPCNGLEQCAPDDPSADARTGCVASAPIDCDDGVECTVDRCDPQNGACQHSADDTACDDGVNCTRDACNAQDGCHNEPSQALCDACLVGAFCSPTQGCLGGIARSCSDGNVCTVDSCSIDRGTCEHTPDANAGDPSCARPSDTCDDAQLLTLNADGTTRVDGRFSSLTSTYDTSCGVAGTRDAVFAIEVDRVSDIILDTTESEADTSLAVSRGACSAQGFGFVCAGALSESHRGSRIVLHRYDPAVSGSRIYVLVDALAASEMRAFALDVEVRAAARDTCDAPLDLGVGGTVVGVIEDRQPENAWGALRGNCQSGNGQKAPEAVFSVRGSTDGTVSLLATSDAFSPALYARTVCDSRDNGDQLACETGQSGRADFTMTLGAAERAFVVLDNGQNGAQYVLRVTP